MVLAWVLHACKKHRSLHQAKATHVPDVITYLESSQAVGVQTSSHRIHQSIAVSTDTSCRVACTDIYIYICKIIGTCSKSESNQRSLVWSKGSQDTSRYLKHIPPQIRTPNSTQDFSRVTSRCRVAPQNHTQHDLVHLGRYLGVLVSAETCSAPSLPPVSQNLV